VIEEKKKQENLDYSFYPNGQRITDTLEEITINMKINNNNENKIDFEKIKYKKKEMTYEDFKYPPIEEQEQNNMLFDNKEKLIGFLNNIQKNTKDVFSEFKLENESLIQIKLNEENNKKINSKYIFFNTLFVLSEKPHQDEDILNNDNIEGFTLFLDEIKNYFLKINSTKCASNDFNQIIINTDFISFKKVIGKHKEIAKKIRELDDGSFISGGNYEIIKYDKNFVQIEEKAPNNYISFFTLKNQVIISLKNKFTSLSVDTSISYIEEIYPCWNLFELDNKYIICNDNGIYYASDIIFNRVLQSKKPRKLYEKDYRGGIKITDYIIAITSNRFQPNGENKLIFFSSKSKKFLKEFEIENYSFTLSENNCSLKRIPNHENNKLLLVACKKYLEGDKNGILLIIMQFKENDIEKTYQKFYETENFEVFCFCQIIEIDNNRYFNEQKNETEYFLVGGFDFNSREGLIKLYKVIYNDEIERIEIEFIQDIIIEKKEGEKDIECFQRFEGAISCIIQSSQGEILVTCKDGNVYLFTKPNLEKIRDN
jgi:hypothetical protein